MRLSVCLSSMVVVVRVVDLVGVWLVVGVWKIIHQNSHQLMMFFILE